MTSPKHKTIHLRHQSIDNCLFVVRLWLSSLRETWQTCPQKPHETPSLKTNSGQFEEGEKNKPFSAISKRF